MARSRLTRVLLLAMLLLPLILLIIRPAAGAERRPSMTPATATTATP